MKEIGKLIEDGYKFSYSCDKNQADEVYLAFVSLKLAFEAFFSTEYDHECPFVGVDKDQEPNFMHGIGYCQEYFKSIVHFQHFFEILIKYILKQENPLLLGGSSRNHLVFYKLIQGENISLNEESKINYIGFAEALSRLIVLLKNKKIDGHENLMFFVEHKKTIEKINNLRNRIWHRGIYTIKGKSFDLLIGRYVIPLVEHIVELDDFKRYKYLWALPKISIGISPLEKIQCETQSKNPSFEIISFLKRVALSAYNIPKLQIASDKIFEERKARSLLSLIGEDNLLKSEIISCPVCGLVTAITQKDTELTTIDNVKCDYCKFYWFNELEHFDIARFLGGCKCA